MKMGQGNMKLDIGFGILSSYVWKSHLHSFYNWKTLGFVHVGKYISHFLTASLIFCWLSIRPSFVLYIQTEFLVAFACNCEFNIIQQSWVWILSLLACLNIEHAFNFAHVLWWNSVLWLLKNFWFQLDSNLLWVDGNTAANSFHFSFSILRAHMFMMLW